VLGVVADIGTLTAIVLRLVIFLLDEAGRRRADEDGVTLDFLVDFLTGVLVDFLLDSLTTSGVSLAFNVSSVFLEGVLFVGVALRFLALDRDGVALALRALALVGVSLALALRALALVGVSLALAILALALVGVGLALRALALVGVSLVLALRALDLVGVSLATAFLALALVGVSLVAFLADDLEGVASFCGVSSFLDFLDDLVSAVGLLSGVLSRGNSTMAVLAGLEAFWDDLFSSMTALTTLAAPR